MVGDSVNCKKEERVISTSTTIEKIG